MENMLGINKLTYKRVFQNEVLFFDINIYQNGNNVDKSPNSK